MTPLNWIGVTPDGTDWFASRAEAEAHVLQYGKAMHQTPRRIFLSWGKVIVAYAPVK